MGDGRRGIRAGGEWERNLPSRWWSATWRAAFVSVIAFLALLIVGEAFATLLLLSFGGTAANASRLIGIAVSLVGALAAFGVGFWRTYHSERP